MTHFPYGPLRIDITFIGGGYQWRVGYKENTLARAHVHAETAELALEKGRLWCAAFRAALVGMRPMGAP